MRQNVEETGPQHCLWPLSYMLEEGKGGLGSAPPAPGTEGLPQKMTERVMVAVRMNTAHSPAKTPTVICQFVRSYNVPASAGPTMEASPSAALKRE